MIVAYNENEPFAAQWLRQLMGAGLISMGGVDERSIAEVKAQDLAEAERVHLFAGIGGWERALALAGWPAGRRVWTGSCPCQPFSSAGKRKGYADSRDLWHEMYRLVRECRPDTIFGEQVASAVGHGWLDRVFADLEAEGYTCGAAVLGAHSVGAPHIRQRVYWVADRTGVGRPGNERRPRTGNEPVAAGCGGAGGVADLSDSRYGRRVGGETEGVSGTARQQRVRPRPGQSGAVGGLGDSGDAGLQGGLGGVDRARSAGPERLPVAGQCDPCFWGSAVPILCKDGKRRRIPAEPGLFPLAHGVRNRVGGLRGAGNAIVPQAAALFNHAFLETEAGLE